MSQLIRIDSSILGEASVSKQLTADFEQLWLNSNEDGKVIYHDFGEQPLPHIKADFVFSNMTPAEQRTDGQKKVLELSDQLISELKQADHIVIAAPMYNFSIPSGLRAYFDHIARAGETFQYTEQGPKGLLTHLKATVLVTSGGDYTQAPLDQMDAVTPYIKTFLGFIGIEVENVIVAPGIANPEIKEGSIDQAKTQIANLFN